MSKHLKEVKEGDVQVSEEGISQVTGKGQFGSLEAGAYLVHLRNGEAMCAWRGTNVGRIGEAIGHLMGSRSLVMSLASVRNRAHGAFE